MLAPRLVARGHTVRVVTSDLGIGPDLPRSQWIERDGYHVWYHPAPRLVGNMAPYWLPGVERPLQKALEDADIVQTHLAFTYVNTVLRRLSSECGVPYIYTPRSTLDPVRLQQRRFAKRAFKALFEADVVRGAAAIHCLNDAEVDHVVRYGGDRGRCRVIPNACALAERDDWPDAAAFHAATGVPHDRPMILYLGRLQSIKGLDLLVDAFARLRDRHADALLVVAGPDEGGGAIVRRHAARHRLGDAVRLVGTLKGDVKLAALRAADVFVLTSYSEGMPNAALESLAAGTPCVLTPACHLPSVERCGAGYVVRPDPVEIASALDRVLIEQRRPNPMRKGARDLAVAQFAPDPVVTRIEAVYAETVAEHR
ncbi:MAG: glycosyltransferase [Planctomycetota bacterium]